MDFDSMTEKEAFKAGFIAFCKEANWSDDQIEQLIKEASEPTWREFGGQLANSLNPFGKAGPKGTNSTDIFDKWYNPWTKNTDPMTRGEGTLMRAGQAGLIIGPAAGATAAAIYAGVPAGLASLGGGIARLFGRGRLPVPPVPPVIPPPGIPAAAAAAAKSGWLGRLGSILGIGGLAAGGSALARGTAQSAGSNLGNLGLFTLGAPIAGGLALGGGLGWGAAKLTDPKVTDDDLKSDELEQAYRIQAKRLKARRDYEKYRSARGLNS